MTEKDIQLDNKFPSNDYIPIATYLNKEIIITKNGDLMMVFKINSVMLNSGENLVEIRESIRTLLMTIFKEENITFYFTTIRKRVDVTPYPIKDNNVYFCKELETAWNKQNFWDDKFINELFLSVIVSLDFNDNFYNPLYFLSSFLQITINMIYKKHLNELLEKLKKIKKIIIEGMKSFDIKLLTMEEDKDGILYSQHMRFFSSIVNLQKYDFPVPFDEISDVIRQKKVNYGIDMVEMIDVDGKKCYASVFTCKMFQNMTLSQVDKLIQAPLNMVITETASLVNNKYVQGLIEGQKKLCDWTEEKELVGYCGIDNYINVDTDKITDYSIGQTTFMITNDTKDGLIEDIKRMYRKLSIIGLVAIKETVFLPSIFWSQIPGNMRYLKRLFILPTNKIGTFFSLFSFPIGKLKFNYWGNAISVLPTAINTPYFFNFHNHEKGNMFILGMPDTGQTTILNFFVAQAIHRANTRVFYIDTKRNSEVFVNAVGGKYYKIGPNLSQDERFNINPFLLENTQENIDFLVELIIQMVEWQDDKMIELGKTLTMQQEQYKNIAEVITKILNSIDKSFNTSIQAFNEEKTAIIYKRLQIWLKNSNYSFVFGDVNTEIINDKVGISLRTLVPEPKILIPVTMYLLHISKNFPDGTPSLLAIDDSYTILDNKRCASIIKNILEVMPDKNMVTLLSINPLIEKKEVETFALNDDFEDNFTTQIFLANSKIDNYQRETFKIQEDEKRLLTAMKPEERNFLLKSLNDIVVASTNLTSFGYLLKILSCDNIAINAYKKAIETAKSDDPDVWIPEFKKVIDNYEKALFDRRSKQMEINQAKWEKMKGGLKASNIVGASAVAKEGTVAPVGGAK
ncbi:MAG: hypothetical protein LBT02_03870 [Rickettsiales bacterium]|jgi:type IV secretion system protein VirB4|nr:hypothetical protein [Rickettsiales bacterium]